MVTYKDIIDLIEQASLLSPGVNSFHYGDLENINKEHNQEFAKVILIPESGTYINNYVNTYSFTLVYIDRLTDDRFKRNIQSRAIHTLKDIINRFKHYSHSEFDDLPYSVDLENINFYTDPQRFIDADSGAYISFSVEANDPDDNCYYIEGEIE